MRLIDRARGVPWETMRTRIAPFVERDAVRRLIDRTRAIPWERVRTRIAPFVVALALIAPFGGVLTSRTQLIERAAPNAAARTPADAADGSVSPRRPAATEEEDSLRDAARDSATEPRSDDAVGRAWADAAAERFARRFGIPVALAEEIHGAAVEEHIEPTVAFGLVRTESSFRRTAVSYAGAVGYTQLLPSTARWIAPGTARGDLFETRTNLRVGFRYLRYLLDRYDGNTRLALLAYNRGPGTVDGILRRGGNPDNGYADKVLRG